VPECSKARKADIAVRGNNHTIAGNHMP